MQFRAVFFDMDGVLLDSFDATVATMNDLTDLRGMHPIPLETLRSSFGQPSERDIEMFFPDWDVDSFNAAFEERFRVHAELVRPVSGAAAILDAMDSRGIATAVITNTPSASLARALLESANIIPNALVTAEDVRRPKPEPDMIFRACEVLEVEPWDILVVGNSAYDKHAAAAAGAPFAGIGGVAGNFTIASLREVEAILDGTYR